MREFTRDEIAQLICRGHLLVLHRDSIYRLNSWAAKHPGGSLAILHFVGRNAASEIEAYHSESTLLRMKPFLVGKVRLNSGWSESRGWEALIPPIQLQKDWERLDERVWAADVESWSDALAFLDVSSSSTKCTLPPIQPADLDCVIPSSITPEKQHQIDLDYYKLHEQVKQEHLYDSTPLSLYRWDLCRYLLLLVGAVYFYFTARSNWQLLLSAFLLGAWKHQLSFFVHDAGHMGVIGSYFWDRLLAIGIADFCGGLSIGWWCDNHNTHHIVTASVYILILLSHFQQNSPEHDPDIQHMPFIAISNRFFSSPYSTYHKRTLLFDAFARFFVACQHKIYYVLMAFGRPNLFANSYGWLLFKAKPGLFRNLELIGITFFWTWFIALLRGISTWQMRVAYVVVCFVTTSPLHVQIVLSHFAQSTEDLGPYESFAHRQLRTTMDVTCPAWLDFFHGGLHMQVSHHLFPRVPRHNLRKLNVLVKDFAARNGLEYHTYGFAEGNGRVLDVLEGVAHQVRMLAKVAQAQAAGEIHHH